MATSEVPAATPAGRARVEWPLVACVVLAVLVGVVMYVYQGWLMDGGDFQVYHQSAVAVLHGTSPYDSATPQHGLLFIYSPFAAIVLSPLGLLPGRLALGVWSTLSVLCLQAVVWLVLRRVGPADRTRRGLLTLAISTAALPLYPVLSNLGLGQINIILMLLVATDVVPGRGRGQGVGIGVAAGIKLTPLVFVPFLLATRRPRAAVTALVAFAATVGLGFLVLPGPSARYWGGLFLDTGRMVPPQSAPYDESLSAVLGRIFGHTQTAGAGWQVVAAVVALAGLVVAVLAARSGRDQAGVMACAVTGLLASPVAWAPHWVWCVPLLALWASLGGAHRWGAVGVWLVLVADSLWFFLSLSGRLVLTGLPGELLGDLVVLVGLAFLVSLAVVVAKDRRRAARPRPVAVPVGP